MNIPFPDGRARPTTRELTAHRLDHCREYVEREKNIVGHVDWHVKEWTNGSVTAKRSKAEETLTNGLIKTKVQLRLFFPDDDRAHLRLMPDNTGFWGGFWPRSHDGENRHVGYTLLPDGDALVLRVFECEPGEPGPLHLPGVDGA